MTGKGRARDDGDAVGLGDDGGTVSRVVTRGIHIHPVGRGARCPRIVSCARNVHVSCDENACVHWHRRWMATLEALVYRNTSGVDASSKAW